MQPGGGGGAGIWPEVEASPRRNATEQWEKEHLMNGPIKLILR